jgi:hypothetical protein
MNRRTSSGEWDFMFELSAKFCEFDVRKRGQR